MSKDRGVIRMVWTNFINSFRPRQIRGNLMGQDTYGTKYYEIPPDRQRGQRKSSRWFVPQEKDDFMKERPAEWEAWLRFRRDKPPTEEEIAKSQLIFDMKKTGAAEIEKGEPTGIPKPIKEGSQPFPKYDDYEEFPGKKPKDQT